MLSCTGKFSYICSLHFNILSFKVYDKMAKVSIHRHVFLPSQIARLLPKTHLLSETEWRNLGVQQSMGWVHYMIHGPGLFCSYHIFINTFLNELQRLKNFQIKVNI